MNRFAPAFVVTMGVACAADVPNDALLTNYPRSLNPEDPEQGTIYLASDGTCYVELPFVEPPTSGGQSRPQRAIPCPPEMRHSTWKECVGAEIRTNEAGDDCICDIAGNPPPPTVPRVACPR